MTGWQDSFQPVQQYDLSTSRGKDQAVLDVFNPKDEVATPVDGWKDSFQPAGLSQKPDMGIGRTAFDQSMQGATFGFADEAQDAIGAGIAHFATGEPYSNLYNEARQGSRQRLSSEIQQNPGTSIAANLAGGLLTGGAGAATKTGTAIANSLRTGNAASRIAKGTLTGATSGGLYGAGTAEDGNRLEGAEQGALLGGGIGGAVPGIGATFGALKSAVGLPEVSETLKPLAQKAMDYGIPLSRSQVGDSKIAKTMASTINEIPFSGSPGFYAKQQNSFNKAVASTIGEDAEKITPEVINTAYKNIGLKFDQALGGQTVKISDDHIHRLASLDMDAMQSLTGDHAKIVQNQLDKLLKDVAPGGIISGEKLGSFRSALTSTIQKTRNDASPYLSDLRDLVVDMGTEGAPDRRDLLNQARSQYKNLKTIEPLAAKAVDGNISPALLQGRIMSNFRDYARGGGGDLGNLSRIGQAFIKDSTPNSGTAKRLAAYTALFEIPSYLAAGPAGLLAGAAKAAGGMAAARGFNTLNTAQKGVKRAISSNPGNYVKTIGMFPGNIAGQIEERQ